MQTLVTMERNNLVEGMDLNEDDDLNFCDECVYGKHHCIPFHLSGVFMQRKFLRLCIQTCGLMATSHGGAKYFLTFIDDFSRKTF
jgi:hypothetical protein